MKLKTIVVSVIVLALLSAAVFFMRRPEQQTSSDPRVSNPLVDRTVIEKATKVRITDQGKTVSLARQSDGTWKVTSYYDLPADFSKLSGFIGNLTDAKIERLVTTRPDRIARLEFKDTKIELLDGNDKELWSVLIGKAPESGSGRYVKFGNEDKAYQANLNAWLDTESKNWANSELLNVKADDVARIEIPFADGGPITVSRAKKDEPWTADKTPAGQKVKADKVASVLGSVGNLRFSDTNPPDDPNVAPAKAHQRVFKLTTFDNKTYTVALGRKPEEKKLKAPSATTDGKSGPGALGSMADLNKKSDDKAEKKEGAEKKDDNKPLGPEYETIPAGPVFVEVKSSDASAPVNALMQKRAFQVSDYIFTGLPQKPDELFEAAPAPAPKPDEKKAEKAEEKKPEQKKDEPRKP
jgi:hypothetical protein